MRQRFIGAALAVVVGLTAQAAAAEGQYDTGASDTEIKLGNTVPYSGPASAYGAIGAVQKALFDKINAEGGINGRKVTFLSLDDGYSPPKTLEQTRKLVERDGVLAMVGSVGTPTNAAVHRYLAQKKVPQLFISSGAAQWNQPNEYPTTIPFYPPYYEEGQIYGAYILENKPDAKIGILYQNDDFGKVYVKGLKDSLGDKAGTMIVQEQSYETTDPNIDSQILSLRAAGADVFFNVTTPKFAAQAIRKIADIGWKPMHFVVNVSSSIGAVLKPAGFDKSTGVMTALTFKTPGDPAWADDQDMKDYFAFMKTYNPEADPYDSFNVLGYVAAQMQKLVLERAGDNLTRKNIVDVFTSVQDVSLPMFLPGVAVTVTPQNYSGYKSFVLSRFDGDKWAPMGEAITVGKAE